MIKASSGEYDIIDSGTVIQFNPLDDIELKCTINSENGEFTFCIKIEFSSKAKDDKVHFDPDESTNTIRIILSDNANLTRSNNKEPIHVAYVDDKKIYFRFSIIQLDKDNLKKIDYTFYKER